MAPKRKATKTAVAVEPETEPIAANSHDATGQITETKKPKKRVASKNSAKPEIEVANDDDVDISPKKSKTRTKRENVKKIVNYVEKSIEEKIEPVKKRSRGKKAPVELVDADENSENDKHVANDSKEADGNAKKRTKKIAVSNKVDKEPAVDKETVEEKPKKAKSTKSKKEENEHSAEVTTPKRKPRTKTEKTASANDEQTPVARGRKRTANKPDEVEVRDRKNLKKVTEKTVDVSPVKKPVKSRKAAKKEEKTDVEVKSSPAHEKKVAESVGSAVKKRQKRSTQISRGGMVSRKKLQNGPLKTDEKEPQLELDDTVDISQKFSSDEDSEAPEQESIVSESVKKARIQVATRTIPQMIGHKITDGRLAAVTKRNKNEKSVIAQDEIKPKQKMNSTTTDYTKINFESDKEHTLKICSWNVAGLRALISKGGFQYFEYEKPDIICLQEIKCLEEEAPIEAKIPGYHMYWCSKKGGRNGVALLSKKMPYNIQDNIGDDEMDEEGRIITAEYSTFYLVGVYVPNAGRKLVNLEKRLRFNKLFEEHVNKLKAIKPVVIVGDMNVAHNEIDLANPKTNTKNAGFSKEERDGMTDLLSHGFIDTFRHLYPDRKNAYTFWTYMGGARAKNVGWRLDYGIVSENIASKVVDNIIRSEVLGSDHCPMLLLLNI